MIRRVLIANRGEIAMRVIRACRAMGIASVAVYSDADADAPHAAAADRAVRIGPPPATESYLNQAAILAAAAETGVDAVHPGYGFLSENAEFADRCAQAGLTFIGPPGDVIRRMGSKIGARETMRAAGVPVVPGETPAAQTDAAIGDAAARVGFPVLLKASAGGGGKGMRVVRAATELRDAIAAARREAERAFGDGAHYVERLIERPRHVEVQVLSDAHGHTVHLFERDCSLQRRHQKVVEESPAPSLAPAVRKALLDAAVRAAQSVGYVNAGTIEFILEGAGDAARFYFLEMNTRLQVEHPVTEAVTGLDLVQLQLRVAAGEALPFAQADVQARGHAVECRVYAEDPTHGFLPQSGRLLVYREPPASAARVDSGVRAGQTISVHYDPVLAKLIVHAPSRAGAFRAAAEALRSFAILGIRHNIRFLTSLVSHPEVLAGHVHTGLIETHLAALTAPASETTTGAAAAMAAFLVAGGRAPAADDDAGGHAEWDPWQALGEVAW